MLAFGVGFSLGALAGGVIDQFAGQQAAFFAAAGLLALAAVAAEASPLRTLSIR